MKGKLMKVIDPKTDRQKLLIDFPLGVYEHYKGGLYTAYSVSLHEETLETLVHYYAHEHKTRWTRTFSNFKETVRSPETGRDRPRFRFDRAATQLEFLVASQNEYLAGQLAKFAEATDYFSKLG